MAEQAEWLHVFIDVAPDVSEESASFWAVLGWPVGEQWPGHPEFRSFTPPAGDSYIHQQIGDHGPRIHFDLEVPDRGTADRLVQLGAVITGYGDGWCPMRSPGGLPFCLVDRVDHARPPAQRFAQHHARLVQICIDSPPKLHDQEVAFWQQATGWRWRAGTSHEFAGKLYPSAGSSAQLLLQRLGSDDPATAVRAHIDLGADDVEAEAGRLVALGAERLGPGRGWIVLRDPVGMVFVSRAIRRTTPESYAGSARTAPQLRARWRFPRRPRRMRDGPALPGEAAQRPTTRRGRLPAVRGCRSCGN